LAKGLEHWWGWAVWISVCGFHVVAAPRIDSYEPTTEVRGDHVTLRGDGLEAAYAVYLKNWRGELVPADLIATQPDRVRCLAPVRSVFFRLRITKGAAE
jgi:hypothetical protein